MASDEDEWKLMRSPAFAAELEAVREEGQHAAFYAQLRYHALQMKRKLGWAAYFYKDYYGEWPNREWEKLPPMCPEPHVVELIEGRDRRFRFEVKMKHQKEERAANVQRLGDGETADELHESEKGAGDLLDGGRVPGMEEEGGGAEELCPPDQ